MPIPSLQERIESKLQQQRPKSPYSRRRTETPQESIEARRNRHLRTRLDEINKGCDLFFKKRNLAVPSASHSIVCGTGEESSIRKFVSRLRQSRLGAKS